MAILKLLEKGFVVFSLLFFTGVNTSDTTTKVLMYGIQAITGLLIVADYKRVMQIALREKLLWIIVAIALFSTFWSDVPSRTIANSINLVRITLFGVYFAARYSLKEQLHLLTWVLGIAAALSLAFIIVMPSSGVMGMGSISSPETIAHAGTWQGIYGHKNVLARIMLLSTIAFFLFTPSKRRHRWLVWGCYVLSIILIVGSTSKTALIIFLTVLALLPLYRALRWNYTLVVPFFIAAILVSGGFSMLLVGSAEDILAAFGRDLTFSGRTDLWMAVLEKIGERPWLGYGYGGFWLGLNGGAVDIWNAVLWRPPHSHNGFLDLWLDLGLLGLSIFAFSFIVTCLRSVAWLRQNHTSEGLWPLAYLTFLLLANLTESSLLRQNLLWVLYVSISLSMYKDCENLAGAKAFLQQKVKKKSIQKIHGSNAYTLKDNNRRLKARILIHTAYWMRVKFPLLSSITNGQLILGMGIYWRTGGIEPESKHIVNNYLSSVALFKKIEINAKAFFRCLITERLNERKEINVRKWIKDA